MTPEQEAVLAAARAWYGSVQADRPEEFHGELAAAVEALELSERATEQYEPELTWVLRTWHNVRRGDTVRIPGTEHTVKLADRYWPPQPMARPMDLKAPHDPQMDVRAATAWHVVPGQDGHWNDHVVRVRPDGVPECVVLFAGETATRTFDPHALIEIQMDALAAEALMDTDDHWSWEERF